MLRTKVKLISQRVDPQEGDRVLEEIRVDFDSDGGLTQMLEQFESFLRGCGYHYDGEVTIEAPETSDDA